MTLLAELGDVTRFPSPAGLMAYVGLVPSEHSSGNRRRQGGITKTGNGHVRRVLIESAWSYRFPARKTQRLHRRQQAATPAACNIAWRAQTRLCGKFRRLTQAGKPHNKVCTAVARELIGFVWDIARHSEIPGNATAVTHT